jgi:putative SOS response-associated peptidase YedK
MCGRFASTLPLEQLAHLFAITEPPPNAAPSWNVAPTQAAVVVRRRPEGVVRTRPEGVVRRRPEGMVRRHPDSEVRKRPEGDARVLSLLSWGLLPSFSQGTGKAPRPINARAETVATNGLFRGAFVSRRCLVPADAYYEWHTANGTKTPYAIARRDGSPCALGGLWEGHRAPDGTITRSFAVVTVPASQDLAHLHPRMPLVVEPGDWASWLGETGGDPASLLHPSPDGVLKAWRIASKVNNPRNDGPDLLAPYEPEAVLTLTPSAAGSGA